MAGRNVRHIDDDALLAEYREALSRAAVAARQAALMSRLLESRGLGALKGEEPAAVDDLLLDAGRRSLDAREGALTA